MEVVFFNDNYPDTLSCEINDWLRKNSDIEIFDIKQTALPPDRILTNPAKLYLEERIEEEADLVVSIWYESKKASGIVEKGKLQKKFAKQNKKTVKA